MKVETIDGLKLQIVSYIDADGKRTITKPATRVAFALVKNPDGTEGAVPKPEIKNWDALPDLIKLKK